MNEGAHGSNGSRFLSTSHGTCRDKSTNVFAVEATRGPDASSLVPESLPLGGEVPIAGRDTAEDCIVLEELRRLSNGVVRLGRRVHFGEDLIGEGFGDSNKSGLATDAGQLHVSYGQCPY